MLAEKYAYLEDMIPAMEPLRREEPKRQKEPIRHEEIRKAPAAWHQTLNRVCTIGLVLVCFAAASFTVFRYALIANNHREILALEQELEQEMILRDKLEVELSYCRDLSTIEFSAAEMGMKYPGEDQVHYVSLPQQESSMEQVDSSAGQGNQSLWARFLGFFN